MNRSEFDNWWDRFARVFPETAAWVNGLRAGKATLLDAWADVMSDVDPKDANEVTKRMLAGTDETLAAFDREKTPAHVRRLAWNLKQGRGEVNREPLLPPVRIDGAFPILRLYADLCDAKEKGATADQLEAITAEFKATYCKPDDEQAGPRFYCATCKDSGFVYCWGPNAMKAMRDGGIEEVRKINSPIVGCLCTCRKGERKSEGPMGNFGKYNVTNLFLCNRGDFRSEANLLALEQEWDAGKKSRFTHKRESTFDAYNQAEF